MMEEVDEKIEELVVFINSLPIIKTIGSCGGHKKPDGLQQPEGHWFVSFVMENCLLGELGHRARKACESCGKQKCFALLKLIEKACKSLKIEFGKGKSECPHCLKAHCCQIEKRWFFVKGSGNYNELIEKIKKKRKETKS